MPQPVPAPGRHRSAEPYRPLRELGVIARSTRETGARASIVLAASGGLVATVAVPAAAISGPDGAGAPAPAALARDAGVGPAPREAVGRGSALVAPPAASPVALPRIATAVVTAVAKPAPRPQRRVAPRADGVTASRQQERRQQERQQERRAAPAAPTPRAVRDVPSSATGVVEIARSLLGIPYRYGGTSPSTGFDCSGFTQYVFAKAGTSLPRTASAQQRAATPVDSPRPGDLVFFGSPVWHVGIYTGNGMMIDSPRKGKSTSERPVFSGVSGYGRF